MKGSRPGARKTDGCSRFPTLPEGCWKVKDRRTAYPSDGSIRQSADTYERITEQLETFYETPQETAGGWNRRWTS